MCPSDGASNYVVNIGLLLQFHYVSLDPVDSINVIEHVSNDNSVSSTNVTDSCYGSTNTATNPDDLNDEVIALGDEHNMSMVAHKFAAFCPLKILKQKTKFYPLHLLKVRNQFH